MIPADPKSVEFRVLAAVDAAFAEARALAGEWLTCHAGCDDCCRRPFAITAADGRRLRAGLDALPLEAQAEIRERAAAARSRMAFDFPGDWATGVLTENEEWREWFVARHAGLACPVLDLETGKCRLYNYRPVACRLAGPLIQIGGSVTDPCPLCFVGVGIADIESTKIVINARIVESDPRGEESMIAFILRE